MLLCVGLFPWSPLWCCCVAWGRVAYSVAGAEPLVWLCADEDDYSATTVRHVREFLKQLGLEAGSKAEIFKTYGLRDGKDGE